MKIDLDGLEAFVCIAEAASFNRAAATLHVSQPALSRRLKRLEELVGVRLLDRTTQKVQLTAVGKAFLPQAHRLVMELRAAAIALGDLTQRRSGMVAIACIPTAAAHFLPAAVSEYSREHPDVQVRVMDQSSAEVMEAVLNSAAEFGISFVGKRDHDLEFEALFEDPFVVVCHRGHPLAKRSTVSWRDLAQHRVARVGPRSGTSLLLDLALSQLGLQLKWFHEVEYHFSSALGLTEAGLVVTVLPRLALPAERAPGKLVARPLTDPPLLRQLGIVRRKGATLSPAAEGLVDVLRGMHTHCGLEAPKKSRTVWKTGSSKRVGKRTQQG